MSLPPDNIYIYIVKGYDTGLAAYMVSNAHNECQHLVEQSDPHSAAFLSRDLASTVRSLP